MKPRETAAQLRRRHRDLARRLARTGLVLQGTITPRSIPRPDPAAPDRIKIYGPYYQWTFKQAGKTVTVNLTAAQARVYQKAIDDNRRMEELILEMRQLSRQICELTTEGVKKRKTNESGELGLS
jgi:hypothetical protein